MRIYLTAAIAGLLFVGTASAQPGPDTLDTDTTVFELEDTLFVIGRRITRETTEFPFEKDRFNQVLVENGFSLITKGVFLAQDIQADGFKRDDITIVVDGERYHSACPNRMDSPLARSNSLEMTSITLDKTSSAGYSGLGGTVAYQRERITDAHQVRAGLSHSAGAADASDVAFAATARNHRLAGRYAVGSGYLDGAGRSFVDLYGYRENSTYRLTEASITGRQPQIDYRAEFTYTEDVMFPYLHMDERTNWVFSGSLAHRGHKLYATHTDHMMDNGLRLSMGQMRTDAANTTVGLTGSMYEAFYRRWNADNQIRTPKQSIDNHMMPGVNQLLASVFHGPRAGSLTYWGRLGFTYFTIEDTDRSSFYEAVHGAQSTHRTFLTWAAGVSAHKPVVSQVTGTVSADVTSEPPAAQSMYIAVERPPGKAWRAGHPGLRAPVRASLRGTLAGGGMSLEASAAYVWDYVNLNGATVDSQTYWTYANVDAVLLSVGLQADWRYLQLAAGYTWANRYPDDTPLAEVPPLYVTYTLRSPSIGRGWLYWRHMYNDAQHRVDLEIDEVPTDSWNRFDAGIVYDVHSLRLSLEVENIFDELYTQHLSYLRSPFASGVRVYEPGRSVRFNVVMFASSTR